MTRLDRWLGEYAQSHKNPTNQLIHTICVPLITITLVAMLWVVPVPQAFAVLPGLNWGSVFMALALMFYLTLDFKMFVAMLVQTSAIFALLFALNDFAYLFHVSAAIFAICWVFQLIGHKVEGAKPSFFKDLTFLLIGPLWVMKKVFKF